MVYETPTPSDEKIIDAANDKARDRYGKEFEVYWEWEELPTDAILLNFRISAKGPIAFDGIYKRDPNFVDFQKDGEIY